MMDEVLVTIPLRDLLNLLTAAAEVPQLEENMKAMQRRMEGLHEMYFRLLEKLNQSK